MAADTKTRTSFLGVLVVSVAAVVAYVTMSHSPGREASHPTDYVSASTVQEAIPKTQLNRDHDGTVLGFVVWHRKAVKQADLTVEVTYHGRTKRLDPTTEGSPIRLNTTALSGWYYEMPYDDTPVVFIAYLPDSQWSRALNCGLWRIERSPEYFDSDRANGRVECSHPHG